MQMLASVVCIIYSAASNRENKKYKQEIQEEKTGRGK